MNYVDRDALERSEVRNFLHSAALIGGMVALLAAVGGLFGGPSGVVLLLLLAVPFLVFSPAVASRMVLRMHRAEPLSHSTAPALVEAVRSLSHRAGLPSMPQLYRIPSPVATAFTVGTRREPAIGVSDGLLRTLGPRELAAVLAHEVSHVRRNDIWVMGLADLVSRATRFMSMFGQVLLLLNLPLVLMGQLPLSWLAILLLVFAPTVSALLQLALARTREYDADLGAARLTGDPRGLALALAKLERSSGGFLERILLPGRRLPEPSFLRTHPRTEDRIERLLEIEHRLPETHDVERRVPVFPALGPQMPRWHSASGSWY